MLCWGGHLGQSNFEALFAANALVEGGVIELQATAAPWNIEGDATHAGGLDGGVSGHEAIPDLLLTSHGPWGKIKLWDRVSVSATDHRPSARPYRPGIKVTLHPH